MQGGEVNKMENIYVADFETLAGEHAIKKNKTHVWAWAVANLNDLENIEYGSSITHFMDWCKKDLRGSNKIVYFHNLKWDSQFCLSFLEIVSKFTWVEDQKYLKTNTYTTLITDDGQYFSLQVCFYRKGKHIQKVTFLDSLKRIPLKVKEIAKTYDMDIQKGEIDYDLYRDSYGHVLTPEEKDYLKRDILIVAKALKIQIEQGLLKTTLSGNALEEYKKIIGKNEFKWLFPELPSQIDKFCRLSYKGGFTYLNPKYEGWTLSKGRILDVNSLYPSVMYECVLPYGIPHYYKGKYTPFQDYTLYIQHIRVNFRVKKGYLPTIQIKNILNENGDIVPDLRFPSNEYVTDTKRQVVDLWLTNVDLELFLEHHDIRGEIEYIDGYRFKGQVGMFKDYINYWSKVKKESKGKNKGLYSLSKLLLNGLYGKFGMNGLKRNKKPFVKDGIIHFTRTEEVQKKTIYVPIASFVTAYGRAKTIRSAQMHIDRYVYSDTDSLHILHLDSVNLEVHDEDLGKWSHDGTFKQAKYLRAKTYFTVLYHELKDNKLSKHKTGTTNKREFKRITFPYKRVELLKHNVTVAGMPDHMHNQVKLTEFKYGMPYIGKQTPKNIQGGCILVPAKFSLGS